MSASKLAEKIGKHADLDTSIGQTRSNRIWVVVKIIDARVAYGRVDYLVTPVQGKGEAWVSEQSLNHVRKYA